MSVIPLREYPPRHAKDPLNRPRSPCPDRLHPAPQRYMVLGFHQQVKVVVLNAVMDETKIAPLTSLCKAPPQLPHEPPVPQPR